jgi:uncharacterized protein (TIGR02266 family)
MSKDVLSPRAPRLRVNEEFALVESHLSEYVTNVSRTGVFIRSTDPLPVGTRVNLKFAILHDEIEVIEGVGEVVRVQTGADPGGQGMGVIFRRLSEPSIKLLDRLCAPVSTSPPTR